MNQREEIERDLRVLGERFVTQFNALVTRLESATDEEAQSFHQLPTFEQLEEIEVWSRSLTTRPVWKGAPTQDRAALAEIRCIVSDAVVYARALDYDNANECVQRAMRRLVKMRERTRTGRNALLPREVDEAMTEAGDMLMSIIRMFTEAERVMGDGQEVLAQ